MKTANLKYINNMLKYIRHIVRLKYVMYFFIKGELEQNEKIFECYVRCLRFAVRSTGIQRGGTDGNAYGHYVPEL